MDLESVSEGDGSEVPLNNQHLNRGGIKVFGLRSRLASDDFVLPAWIAFLTRVIYLTTTLAIMVYSMQIVKLGESCLNKFSLDIYMPTVVGLMSFNTILCLFLALSSGKGVIWDENPKSRKFVSPLFHLCLVLGIAEIILVIFGTKKISEVLNSECAKTQSELNSMYVILVLIIFKWLGIAIILLIFIGSLKDLWPICCCRSRARGNRGQLGNMVEHVTDPGECCFYIFKRCCVASKQIDYFNDVADLINDIFEDEAFVPTDIAAALILLAEKNNCAQTLSDQELRPNMKNKEIHLRYLEEYMSYSSAMYGASMYLYDGKCSFKSCFELASKASFCTSCCCCSKCSSQDYYNSESGCSGCNLATLKLMVPHINEQDIIHMSTRNNFLETPFLVVADTKLQKIVIAIRGTLSLADVMTDMVARPKSLKTMLTEEFANRNFLCAQEISSLNEMAEDIEVHAGMAEAAIFIFQQIREKHLLDKAYVEYPDFPLVVTGHSLGAGTAVILSFMLRLKYNSVKCFAFGPPGGLLNSQAYAISTTFVTSVVVGDDIICRLSVKGYKKLACNMKQALLACQLPKHKVLATGLCNCLSPLTWKERLQRDPSVASQAFLEEGQISLSNYGSSDSSSDFLRTPEVFEMLPPGKIIHISEIQQQVTMCFRNPKDFNQIVVSAEMINDHMPASYQRMISRAKQRFTHQNNAQQDLNPSI